MGTFDTKKKETRHPIEDIQGIYALREPLRAMAQYWLSLDPPAEKSKAEDVKKD